MALITPGTPPREADVTKRFNIAQDGVPTEEQKMAQRRVRTAVSTLAHFINTEVEDNREKSLALTALEEALMWAGKAIFK